MAALQKLGILPSPDVELDSEAEAELEARMIAEMDA
jgi:hypothetical protein